MASSSLCLNTANLVTSSFAVMYVCECVFTFELKKEENIFTKTV